MFRSPAHGADVEGGDLVIRKIGRNETLRRFRVGEDLNSRSGKSDHIQVAEVQLKIVAGRGMDRRFFAEERQIVGDIAGRSADLHVQRVHVERDVQLVDFVGQNMVPEFIGERHDMVVRQRAGDEDGEGDYKIYVIVLL